MNVRTPDSASAHTVPLIHSVRAGDYDRFLTVLFAPVERRAALVALIAFNLEIARIRDLVTEPMLGQIRLQWWHEACAEAFAGKPRRHDVLESLAQGPVPPSLIEEILDAREIEYQPEPIATLSDLRSYASGTSGALTEAMAAVLGGNTVSRKAARAVGTAFGLAGVLRAVRFHANHNRVLLPSALLEESGTSTGALQALRSEPGLARAAERIADAAREELATARGLELGRDSDSRAVFSLTPLTEAYLARLQKKKFDLLGADLTLTPLRKQLTVGWASLRGKF